MAHKYLSLPGKEGEQFHIEPSDERAYPLRIYMDDGENYATLYFTKVEVKKMAKYFLEYYLEHA